MEWFGVRHVIDLGAGRFEERVTLWQDASEDAAITQAEVEASSYAASIGGTRLDLFQTYRLADPPASGREVFSLIRSTSLPSEQYVDAFFDTGAEHQRTDS